MAIDSNVVSMVQRGSGAVRDPRVGGAFFSPTRIGSPGFWLDRLTRRMLTRNAWMQLYMNYYVGNHRYGPIAERIRLLMGEHFHKINVNYCETVVDKLIERLEVTGFRTSKGEEASPDAWTIWQRNALDQEFAKGLRQGAVKSEFSVSVWPDKKGKARIRVEDPMLMIVATEPENRRERRAALKRWFDTDYGKWMATLYLPDDIYKLEAFTVPGDPALQQFWEQEYWTQLSPWQTWVPRTGAGDNWHVPNPYGVVPVIPFPNKPDLLGVGTSELRNIVPIQDKVNKINFDLLLASEFAAFPQKWVTNIDLERDENTGRVVEPFKVSVDRLFTAPPPEAGNPPTEFGQFDPAELRNWITALDNCLQQIAVISSMPPHYLLGNSGVFPSGESLRAAETGLTQKARDKQRDDSEPLEEVMRLAGLIEENDQLAKADELETIWRNPETRTDAATLDSLTKQASLGVPKHGVWEQIPDVTPTKIKHWDALIKGGDDVLAVTPDVDVRGAGPNLTQQASGTSAVPPPAEPAPAKPRQIRVQRDASGTTVSEVPA